MSSPMDPNELDVQREEEVASEALTTASTGHPCNQCGRQLRGRQQRFCSDRCRMITKRQERAARIERMLEMLEVATAELREELLNEEEKAPRG